MADQTQTENVSPRSQRVASLEAKTQRVDDYLRDFTPKLTDIIARLATLESAGA